MPTFLLDANRSPKIGRYLASRFGLDVVSLLDRGLGELPDHEVLRLARAEGRVVITLDRDFTQPYAATGRLTQGVIYLDLPNTHRYVPDIQRLLGAFFADQAAEIDLDASLVIVRNDRVIIRHQ